MNHHPQRKVEMFYGEKFESVNAFISKMHIQLSYATLNDRYNDLQRQYKEIENSLLESKSTVKSLVENSKDVYLQLTAILGIFSGIVLAFSGGLGLIGESINVLQTVSKYRLFLLVLFLCFSLFNIITSMMFMIARLIKRDIGVCCKHGDYHGRCDGCTRYKKHINIVCQAYNKYPYITIVNLIILYAMYGIVVSWMFSSNNSWMFSYLFGERMFSILNTTGVRGILLIVLLLSPALLLNLLLKYMNKENKED